MVKQAWNHAARALRASRAYWEKTGRQVRPEHWEHPELTGRQVGDQSTKSIESLLGDKWETNGEHWEHPELTGRQVGDKWETSLKSCGQALRASRAYWQTNGKQMGDKYKIMRPEHWELGDKGEIMRPGTQARRQTRNHPARARWGKRKQKGDKADTVTNKKGDKGRQAGRKADTLSRSKADTLRKLWRNHIGDKWIEMLHGQRKKVDTIIAGTKPGRRK